MKTIHIGYNARGVVSGIDTSEGIELGDITEIRCKDKTFLVRIVRWSMDGPTCSRCALNDVRCLKGTRGICNRIIPRKRVCFQELGAMMEDI